MSAPKIELCNYSVELITGLIDKIKWDAGQPDPLKPLPMVRKDEPLTLMQLVPVFLILSGGLVTSAIAFLCERLAASRRLDNNKFMY